MKQNLLLNFGFQFDTVAIGLEQVMGDEMMRPITMETMLMIVLSDRHS